jgi:hypothetical protein
MCRPPQQEVFHDELAVARWKWRAARTTRYRTGSGLGASFNFGNLVERVAVRAMEKNFVGHDVPHAGILLAVAQGTSATTDLQRHLF